MAIRPQHSSGRASVAWATISSRSARGSRKPALGLRGLQLGVIVVVVDLGAGDGVLELAHAAAERAADLGQALRTQDEQRDDEHDHEFHGTDVGHALKGSRLAVLEPADGNKVLTLRSEEHTSELQSRQYLVCRLLLEKKKKTLPEASKRQNATQV